MIIEIVGIVLGVLIILWQVRRNHRSSLELQRRNFREEIRHQLFRELMEKVQRAQVAVATAEIRVMTLPGRLKLQWEQTKQFGSKTSMIEDRSLKLSDLNADMITSVNELTFLVERHEIVDPVFRLFSRMFVHQGDVCGVAFHNFFYAVTPFLPSDIPRDEAERRGIDYTLPGIEPKDEDLARIDELSGQYFDACMDLASYLFDLTIEAQNQLIGPIFDRKLNPRKPMDKDKLVISSDSEAVKKLESYLNDIEKKKDQ